MYNQKERLSLIVTKPFMNYKQNIWKTENKWTKWVLEKMFSDHKKRVRQGKRRRDK